MPVTIYHNPRCNTSRKTLALLRAKGVEPEIIEYLKTPYTAAQLKKLLGQLKMPAGKLLRKKEAAAAGIDASKLDEDQLIAAMVKDPPRMYRYQLKRLSRGNARSRAPIINGTRKFPSVEGIDGIRKNQTMMTPCMVKSLL